MSTCSYSQCQQVVLTFSGFSTALQHGVMPHEGVGVHCCTADRMTIDSSCDSLNTTLRRLFGSTAILVVLFIRAGVIEI